MSFLYNSGSQPLGLWEIISTGLTTLYRNEISIRKMHKNPVKNQVFLKKKELKNYVKLSLKPVIKKIYLLICRQKH